MEIKLHCTDCKQEFIFSEREQTFFAERGFKTQPKRCLDCRKKRNERKDGRRRKSGSSW